MYLLRPVELLLERMYRLDEPSLVRDRPMKVLALGLSRCGTESLKFALEDLGYKGVYHGYEVNGDQAMVATWLWDAKMAEPCKKIGVEDFDRFIGNYEAVTDAVGCMFAKELIEAYPNAKVCCLSWNSGSTRATDPCTKVILNRRKDVAAWDRSVRTTLLKGLRDNWWLKSLSFFSPDYFWLRQITVRYLADFFDGSFEKHGVDVYQAHYRQLEDALGEGNYLNWTVEDGWYVAYHAFSLRPCLLASQSRLIVAKGTPVRLFV